MAQVSHRLQPRFIIAQSAVPRATIRLLLLGNILKFYPPLMGYFSPTGTGSEETGVR